MHRSLPYPFAVLHCWSPPAVVVSQRKARKCSHVPAYLLLWFGLVRELLDRNALPVLFHTPKDVPGNNPPIRKTKSPRASAYLRSLTATLAPFSSHPFVRQNASQLSIDTFFSEPRPIAFKKSPGVAILPDHCLVSIWAQYWIDHGIPLGSGSDRMAGALCTDLVQCRTTLSDKCLSENILGTFESSNLPVHYCRGSRDTLQYALRTSAVFTARRGAGSRLIYVLHTTNPHITTLDRIMNTEHSKHGSIPQEQILLLLLYPPCNGVRCVNNRSLGQPW